MPILHSDPNKETDRCYTPLERRRRDAMRLRSVSYGFFSPGRPQSKINCEACGKDVTNIPHLVVNGVHTCYNACR